MKVANICIDDSGWCVKMYDQNSVAVNILINVTQLWYVTGFAEVLKVPHVGKNSLKSVQN